MREILLTMGKQLTPTVFHSKYMKTLELLFKLAVLIYIIATYFYISSLQRDVELQFQLIKSLTNISQSQMSSLKMINNRVDLAWEVLEN